MKTFVLETLIDTKNLSLHRFCCWFARYNRYYT